MITTLQKVRKKEKGIFYGYLDTPGKYFTDTFDPAGLLAVRFCNRWNLNGLFVKRKKTENIKLKDIYILCSI